MINLLDADSLRYYRAARLNMKLRGYFVLLLITLAIILAMFAMGVYLTRTERAAAEAELQAGKASVSQYDNVRKEAEAFTSNLRTAKSILSQEVLYSDMVVRIAKTLPSSAVLSSLALDQTTLTKPITLSARAQTKDDAVILKNTLEASPMFDSVNINTINQEVVSESTKGIARTYPVTIILSMNVTKGQPGSLLP